MSGRFCFWLLLGILASLALPGRAAAHFGAPYPVLLEQQMGPYLASVIADPDVGTGTFYVQATMEDGASLPEGTGVQLFVQPEDGHAAESGHAAVREVERGEVRYVAEIPFDAEGMWQVRLVVEGPAGRGEATFPVRVTPPGPTWLVTLLCLIPFFVVGALWVLGSRRRRREEGE